MLSRVGFVNWNSIHLAITLILPFWKGILWFGTGFLWVSLLVAFAIDVWIVWRDAFTLGYKHTHIWKLCRLTLILFINGRIENGLFIVFRLLTYRYRALPDVMILGEIKCATTTLALYFKNIFGMHAPFYPWVNDANNKHTESVANKEAEYFRGIYDSYMNPNYYSACFGLRITNKQKQKIWFDGCPNYLFLPFIRDRLLKVFNKRSQYTTKPPKFIMVVREPIARAISNFKMEYTYQIEKEYYYEQLGGMQRRFLPQKLNQCLDYCLSKEFNDKYDNLKAIGCNERVPDYYPLIERFGIVQRGQYQDTLKWYFECCDSNGLFAENTLVIDFKEITTDGETTKKTLKKIARFLEIDASKIDWDLVDTNVHTNKANKLNQDVVDGKGKQRLNNIFCNDYRQLLNDYLQSVDGYQGHKL